MPHPVLFRCQRAQRVLRPVASALGARGYLSPRCNPYRASGLRLRSKVEGGLSGRSVAAFMAAMVRRMRLADLRRTASGGLVVVPLRLVPTLPFLARIGFPLFQEAGEAVDDGLCLYSPRHLLFLTCF